MLYTLVAVCVVAETPGEAIVVEVLAHRHSPHARRSRQVEGNVGAEGIGRRCDSCIPDLESAVVGRGGEAFAVRKECDCLHGEVMPLGKAAGTSFEIEDEDVGISVRVESTYEKASIRAERHVRCCGRDLVDALVSRAHVVGV